MTIADQSPSSRFTWTVYDTISDRASLLRAAAQGPLTNEPVRSLPGVGRQAAAALLVGLVRERVLEQHGQERGTYYTLRKK
ncbi:MAG: hypothetical protein M3235_01675 [Actinomycetota bacterium]|nr:hypothetical protein [Actinomycetota bacterium]